MHKYLPKPEMAKIISGAHLHYKWILHTKFSSNRTVRFRRTARTDGRTDVERRPCHKGISYIIGAALKMVDNLY